MEVTINKQTKLSQHFTLGELTKTNTRIKNVPNEAQVNNLKRLCGWLEMLRSEWNKRYGSLSSLSPNPSPKGEGNFKGEGSGCQEDPIIINSGYRSPERNKKVGGAPTSNHLTGCAVDIHVAGIEQAMRYAVILMDYADETKQDYDELLIERSPHGNYWVHFAVRPKENRRKTMIIQT